MTERILCFAAHPDDETLGCGATLAKHAKAGDEVAVVVFADGVGSRAESGIIGFQKAVAIRHGMLRRACKILGTENVYIHQYADNMMDNVDLLQIVQHVEIHLRRFNPTVVYTHHGGDLNVDHRVMHQAVRTACRPQPGSTVKRLLYFEVPCSTAWGKGFVPTHFEDVSDTLETKLKAMAEYTSELRPWPHPRSVEGIRTLAQYRGSSVGIPLAEAFMVERTIA